MERSGGLRLENTTFEGNVAPDGADVAVEAAQPDVFASPEIIVHSVGVSRSVEVIGVPSRTLAASGSFGFPDAGDVFDAEIAAVRGYLLTLQNLLSAAYGRASFVFPLVAIVQP